MKKTDLMAYSNRRTAGIIAINLEEADHLIGAALIREGQEVLLSTRKGQSIRFREKDVRPMGRTAVA